MASKAQRPQSEEDFISALLRVRSEKKDDDLIMSDQEAKRYEECFKSPEFRELFQQYMDDISDPKVREERLQMIEQVEREQGVPKGKKAIRPTPHYVVKTAYRRGQRDPMKLFINVVSSDVLQEPGNVNGSSINIATSVGPTRQVADKAGKPALAIDACFHPLMLRNRGTKAEKEILVRHALSQVKAMLKLNIGDEVELVESQLSILQGVTYKSGSVEPMMLNESQLNDTAVKEAKEPASRDSGAIPPAVNVTAAPPSKRAQAKPAVRKGFLNAGSRSSSNSSPPSSSSTLNPQNGASETNAREDCAIRARFSMVERGHFDLSDHMTGTPVGTGGAPERRRPRELVFKIPLPPGVASAKEMDLEVSEAKILLSTPADPAYMDLKLPYPVNSESGTAKFDKSRQELVVTLPVLPSEPVQVRPSEQELPSVQLTGEHQESEDDAEESVAPSSTTPEKSMQHPDHGRWVSADPLPREKFIFDVPASPIIVSEVAPPAPPASDKEVAELPAGRDFMPSPAWVGAHLGYVFKKGERGQGYYKDGAYQPSLPPYDWRQDDKSVSLLVKVENVQKESLDCNFGSRHLGASFLAGDGRRYELSIPLSGAVVQDCCRSDVSSDNVVFILPKDGKGFWKSLVSSEDGGSRELDARAGDSTPSSSSSQEQQQEILAAAGRMSGVLEANPQDFCLENSLVNELE